MDAQRIRQALLSGTSFAALLLAPNLAAQAAGITVNAATPTVSVTTAQAFDFIEIIAGGSVAGNVTNSGTVGLLTLPARPFGISIGGSGVGGDVINESAGTIQATQTGIVVETGVSVGGGITNSGLINVSKSGLTAADTLVGIWIDSGSLGEPITNAGTISVFARDTGAAATASAIGVNFIQDAALDGIGAAAFNNTADGDLRVVAFASGTGANASATGINISIANPTTSSTVGVVNQGDVVVAAGAVNVTGTASASVAGILLNAPSSGTGIAALNNSGSIRAGAVAIGEVANATAAGVRISASSNGGAGGIALAALDNSGLLHVLAEANAAATGGAAATAYASMATGIHLEAETDGGDATAQFANSGTINLVARANAQTTGGGTANARAYFATGMLISANSGGVANDESIATLDNTGVLVLQAAAVAKGTGTAYATASAPVTGFGIRVFAEHGDDNIARLSNGGTLAIGMAAQAVGESAHAFASLPSGLWMSAVGTAAGSTAEASFVNTGTFTLTAAAQATGDSLGFASALITDSVWLEAHGDSASAALNNSGFLGVQAQALANATGSAIAQARHTQYGIYVLASATVGDQQLAALQLVNSGSININAMAQAIGGTAANATASQRYGIWLTANGGDVSQALIDNSGILNIQALAQATGDSANASAYIDTAVYMTASAGDDLTLATATLNNSGSLIAKAGALANGQSNAYASAYLSTGLNQFVYYGDNVSAAFANTGTVAFMAQAQANAATGGGFRQRRDQSGRLAICLCQRP